MFERFAKDARNAVVSALSEARLRQDPYVGTEHLLLGVASEPPFKMARTVGLSLDGLRASLDSLDMDALHAIGVSFESGIIGGPEGGRQIHRRNRRFTGGAKQVLTTSLEETIRLGHRELGREHILLAITGRPSHDPAVQMLEHAGLNPTTIRTNLLDQFRPSA